MYQMGLIVADETLICHMPWNLYPCVAQSNDPRWGRTYESYGTDLDKVKAAINEIQTSNPLIIQNAIEDSPVVAAPWLGITEFSETGVVVNTRTWCKTEDYWTVYFYMNDTVYQQLKDRGFMFPHKAVDVNVIK